MTNLSILQEVILPCGLCRGTAIICVGIRPNSRKCGLPKLLVDKKQIFCEKCGQRGESFYHHGKEATLAIEDWNDKQQRMVRE